MRLYQGWHSSASWRVRWALAIKEIAYDSVWLDIAAGEHFERLASINPLCTVPVLELDDGDVLTESVAILEWLEETRRARRLLPDDLHQRARVRALVQLVNADIHPLQNTSVRKAISSNEPAQRRWCARWIERGLCAYESLVAAHGGRFSAGDELTMAELFLVPQVVNAERFGADLSACPRVRAIYDACMQLPELRETHPRRALQLAAAARGQPVT
jgi:maleylacetoacetate isomerase